MDSISTLDPLQALQPILLHKELPVPPYTPINVQDLQARYPMFKLVSLPDVQQMIKGQKLQAMYLGAIATHIQYVPRNPPNICHITFPSPPGIDIDPPTHMVAIRGVINTLLPIHHLLLAINCACIPFFPLSEADYSADATHVPIVHLPLPSPETFPILHSYLYTKNKDAVMRHVHYTYAGEREIESLSRSIKMILGLFMNACELGFVETEFYIFLNELRAEAVDRLVQYPGYAYAEEHPFLGFDP